MAQSMLAGATVLCYRSVEKQTGLPVDSAMRIAASGMAAAMASLTATASNVANALTTGPVPDGARPPENVYQSATVVATSLSDGGVSATVIRAPSCSMSYQPAAPFANAQG